MGIFGTFDTALQAPPFSLTKIGTGSYQKAGNVTVASALYSAMMAQALIKVADSQITLYLNLLWDGVPDMAALKTMVQTTFGYTGVTILEDTVTL